MLPTQGSMAEPCRRERGLGTYAEATIATRQQPKPGGVALAGGGGLHSVDEESRLTNL